MPIIACVTAGVSAIIRHLGPESIGGVGDLGARIDAEIARTGLPAEVISQKVYISLKMFLDGLIDLIYIFKDI